MLGVQQAGLETFAEYAVGSALSACDLSWWDVVENKVNPTLIALVHHAVTLLVIDLIHLPDLERIGTAVDHKAHPWVGVDGDVDSVTMMKRRVAVMMGFDNAASLQTRRHGPYDRATRWIVIFKDLMHQW